MPARVEPTPPLPGLSSVAGKRLIARFDGGQLSSDGGLLTLREIERRLGLAVRACQWLAQKFTAADPELTDDGAWRGQPAALDQKRSPFQTHSPFLPRRCADALGIFGAQIG